MSILEEKLTRLIRAIEGSLESKNLYAALSLSLTLPDICSSIIHRGKTTGKYYAQFIEEYFLSIHDYDPKFVKADDIYALRCAYLHNGTVDITAHNVRKEINKYIFVTSDANNFFHQNYINSIDDEGEKNLILQVDVTEFCLEIIDAVLVFIFIEKESEICNERASELITIHNIDNGFSF